MMSELVDFTARVEQQLADANRRPHWEPGESARYMAEVAVRREHFEQTASRLTEAVIRPRLEALAVCFPNATLTKNDPPAHCSCWFGYCERFPASTKVEFAVEHDVRFEKVVVAYEVSMVPVFIRLNEHDKLTLMPTEVNDGAVADWVEERLLEFLDTYMRVDRGSERLDEEVVTDPVCGMRISRSLDMSSATHLGHSYYFCSQDCQAKFSRNPTAYVQVRPI